MSEPPITQQAVHVSAGSNLPITRIVIHATCPDMGYAAASAPGTCAGTAEYFTNPASGGSAQYITGVEREDHCVADNEVAWHAPPNPGSIGIEITAEGGNYANNYTRAQWLSPQVWPAVVRAASRTRELCIRFGVPMVRISTADLLAGRHGICGHDDVSAAWHQTDHSDPGLNFPWAEFMALVLGNPAPPVRKAPTMTVIQAPNGAIYMSDGFQKRHILGMPEVQGWLKALHQADAESVPQVVIDNLAGAK